MAFGRPPTRFFVTVSLPTGLGVLVIVQISLSDPDIAADQTPGVPVRVGLKVPAPFFWHEISVLYAASRPLLITSRR